MSQPQLARVLYELFEFEASVLDAPGAETRHCIDREVHLLMSDGTSWFVSWSDEPVQHAVGVQSMSSFRHGKYVERDASQHQLWFPLLEQPLEFIFLNDENQVLEIRSPNGSVFVSSQENGHWFSDVATISGFRPKYGA